MLSLLSTALISFLAVRLDEFVVLVIFFARSRSGDDDEILKPWHIFAGNFIGFTIVLIASILVGLMGLYVPGKYVALLGLVPLYMGIVDLRKYYLRNCQRPSSPPASDSSKGSSNVELSQQSKTASQYHSLDNTEHGQVTASTETDTSSQPTPSSSDSLCAPGLWLVLSTVLAEGSEEIAVFAPVLATAVSTTQSQFTVHNLVLLLLVWNGLLLVECVCAFVLSSVLMHQQSMVKQVCKLLLPFLLIVLGLSILSESVLADLL